ncbi:MAG: 16S rRNA (cytidine(1402)-2'-O)-methyltransferase [Oligoflexia bacterium]|nr:16S rRNA (cytidine(1402)-2'-O)-methyltransferase [Oligoflexia bacterium]
MSDKKRQDLPGGLWVVATPIGNIGDLTPRAREALEAADAILCEDTRQAAKLLAVVGLRRPLSTLERVDAHATEGRLGSLVERLLAGSSFALVTDAGTPAISDPGARLVALARESGVLVTAVPGVSAVTALLSVSGFGETSFVFRGFFPRKRGDREAELSLARDAEVARVFVWFESPNRILESLAAVAGMLPEARVAVAKELTKAHEKVWVQGAEAARAQVEEELAREGTRGEWCFAVLLAQKPTEVRECSDWVKALRCVLDAGVPASEAARQVSQHFGAAKKEVYERALQLSGKKNSNSY